MRGMHGHGSRTQRAGIGKQPGRSNAVPRDARIIFCALFRQMKVQWDVAVAGPVGNVAELISRHRTHRMNRGADVHTSSPIKLAHTSSPPSSVAIAEALLHRRKRLTY